MQALFPLSATCLQRERNLHELREISRRAREDFLGCHINEFVRMYEYVYVFYESTFFYTFVYDCLTHKSN